MKPRVMSLVVFTALVGLVAAPGSMHPVLAIAALICIAAGAGAAGALNMWYDADIDAAWRAPPRGPFRAGALRPRRRAISAWCSGLWLGDLPRPDGQLAGGCSACATIAFYVFVYTMWLKRATPQNIVIGGAAGAVPPDDRLGGGDRRHQPRARRLCSSSSSSGRRRISGRWRCSAPAIMSAPACRCCRWSRAPDATRLQILIYSLILAPLGMVPAIIGLGGTLYMAAAAVLGSLFVVIALACYRQREGEAADRAAKNLFAYSVLYLFLLFAVLLVEQGFGIDGGALPLLWTS